MADQERQYVGSGKKVASYDLVNIALCVSDIPKDKIYEYKGKKYLNLTLGGKRDGKDKFGRTHSLWINEFQPDKNKKSNSDEERDMPPSEDAASQDDINSIPF